MLNPLRDRRTLVLLALMAVACAYGLDAAHAQSPLGIGTAEPSVQIGGPFAGLFAYVNHYQQAFYRALTEALKAMRTDPHQLWVLIGLSFAYGVFHAAGPGHGKAVISSYMIANEIQLRRGILIAFLSAFLQGAVAIVLVGAAYFALRGTAITMTKATQVLEIASFVLIVLFGLWLLFKKVRSLGFSMPRAVPSATMAGLAPAGVTADLFANAEPLERIDTRAGSLAQAGHVHFPGCEHDLSSGVTCATCGHAHVADPDLLGSERFDLREAWSAVVAVGMRPCSGALLVMTFSLLNGLYLGGGLSVLAMSLGTAITVSVLATMAVTAKGLALRFAGTTSPAAAWIGHGIEIVGALFVVLMGLLLLGAALQGVSIN